MPKRAATLAALAATAALVAACEVDVPPGAVPVPFSMAPTPSASAGVPKYVCTAVYQILTDGAVRLAGFAADTGEAARDGIRQTFTDMAAKVDEETARTTDPALRQALTDISDSLTSGARQGDPRAYVDGGFATVGRKLDGMCG